MMKKLFYPVLCLFLLIQTGCGPKTSEVLKKYEGDFAKKREQFRKIAETVSGASQNHGSKPCSSLNPALEFNQRTKQFNTEMVMFEQLTDPDAKPKMDLLLNGELLNSIQWTGPKNPMSESRLNESGGNFEETLKNALNYRYLVVNRISNLIEPVAMDEKSFTGGKMTVETFLIDLTNNSLICSFSTDAKSAPETSYSYKEGQSKKEQLEKFARSTMWEEARKKTIEMLRNNAGAKIELN